MSMNIIPLPFRDLIRCTQKKLEELQLQHSISNEEPTDRNANTDMKKIHLRISIATTGVLIASGVFLACGNGWNTTLAVVGLGSCVSMPATAIAGGSHALGLGIYHIISCLSQGIFTNFAKNLATMLGGWLILDNYNILPFGLIEPNKIQKYKLIFF